MWSEEIAELAVRERFPDLTASGLTALHGGWDTHAFVAGDRWVVRVARRPEVEAQLLGEVELLARIAPHLPLPVPTVVRVSRESPACIVMNRIDGSPADGARATAFDLGGFLAALHGLPSGPASAVAEWRDAHERRREEFEHHVFPLLERGERRRAADLFSSLTFDFAPALVHGDLAPAHVLCTPPGRIAGVIDWGDARTGDPAIDLAWALHGQDEAFAEALLSTYGDVDDSTRRRACFYYRRAPWYEVVYGLQKGRPDLVAAGLASVRARL